MAKELNLNTNEVYAAIERVTAWPVEEVEEIEEAPKRKNKERRTPGVREAKQRMTTGKTQGVKGLKSPRINLALTTPNYEYVKIMAGASGLTMTEFINGCIGAHRESHHALYNKAKSCRKAFDE